MKATAAPASAAAERQLKSFIAKFEPKHQTLIRAVRKGLGKLFPTAYELAYDNYNFFVIGYGPTERPSDCVVSIALGPTVSACASFTGRGFPTRTRFFWGRAGKRALSGSIRWTRWRVRRSSPDCRRHGSSADTISTMGCARRGARR
jgi:hypothetical protein